MSDSINPIVNTDQGAIKGMVSKTKNDVQYYTFKGIPYAKAPVGELRFMAPQPPETWEGVRDGTKDCNICAQLDKASGTVVGDEDCLFLNVYTPELPKSKSSLKAVMLFSHGGGFIFGNGTDSAHHGPDFLIEKDVVMVSFNYRVGILGFLSLDRKEVPGNMGLKDQVEALKWVQKNITNFGGDPNNVTIFGISAGGASVEYLLISPTAKGLFHKAISQSGSSLIHWAQNENVKDLAFKIPVLKEKIITTDEELLKYLKDMPVKELIKFSIDVIVADEFKGGIHFGFVPTVEKPIEWEPFIEKSTYQLLARGEFTKVPYMSGICSREGLLMVSHGGPILEKFVKEKKFVDRFPFELDDLEKDYYEAKLREIYLEGESISTTEADAFAIDYFSDADFLGGIYTSAMLISKHNAPVYFYEFAYDGALNYLKKCYGVDRKGACHGDDGGYLLKNDKLTETLSETDKYVKNLMLELWTNFAKHGDPNPRLDDFITAKWEPITEAGPACFVIDEKPYMKYEVYPARVKLYEELYEKKFGEKRTD